jgi:transposase InsO family protein
MAVDDASRVAVGEVLPDETAATAVGFLERLVRNLRRLGVRVAAVMTDNDACYKSHRFAAACRRLRLRHLRTRRYTPRTNGKVERFIKTSLLEWAYARVYRHSDERRAAFAPWLHYYNWHRRHTSLGGQAPVTRVLLRGQRSEVSQPAGRRHRPFVRRRHAASRRRTTSTTTAGRRSWRRNMV